MLRKLITSISVFVIVLLGFSSVSPASASTDYTTAPSSTANSDVRSVRGALGKTLTGEMVYAYAGGQDGGNYYVRSYRVNSTGAVSEPTTIISENTGRIFTFDSKTMSWVDPAGTIYLAFTMSRASNFSIDTAIYITSTQDGITWATPTILGSYNSLTGSACFQSNDACGVRYAALAHTATGELAIAYTVLKPDNSSEVRFSVKPAGKSWGTPYVINSSATNSTDVNLVSIGKGYLATWKYVANNFSHLVSSYSTGVSARTWTAPQERATSQCLSIWNIQQTAPTKFAVVYADGCETNNGNHVVYSQTFDTKDNRFGSQQQLTSFVGFVFERAHTELVAGQSAIGFSNYIGDTTSGAVKYILFKNGLATVQFVNQNLAEIDNDLQIFQGISLDLLGHLTIIWVNSHPSLFPTTMYLSMIYRGNRADADVSLPNQQIGNYDVGFSMDNDVYITTWWSSTISSRVRIRSDAPTLLTDVAVTGTAKVKSAVAVRLPKIEANSLGQRWSMSYQWYSCQFRVAEVSSSASNNCSPIAGATKSTYKVSSADKGQYLQVRLNITSDNAVQTQFSTSTAAVK